MPSDGCRGVYEQAVSVSQPPNRHVHSGVVQCATYLSVFFFFFLNPHRLSVLSSPIVSLAFVHFLLLTHPSGTQGEQQRCGWTSIKISTMPLSPQQEMSPMGSKYYEVLALWELNIIMELDHKITKAAT